MTTATITNGLNLPAVERLVADCHADPANAQTRWRVTTAWQGGAVTRTTAASYDIGGRTVAKDFTVMTDEPLELGGTNRHANPQETLMAAINACMTVGYAAVAALMNIELESLEIETEGDIDLRGFLAIDKSIIPGYPELRSTVRLKADAPRAKLEQLHKAVQATSPNFYNITTAIPLRASLVIA